MIERAPSPRRSPSILRAAAPRDAWKRALTAGALTLLALYVPLAWGYGYMQRSSWDEIAAAGLLVSPEFYAAFPLQIPRLFVLSLFAIGVATWSSLFLLLPLEDRYEGAFVAARRRLRRHWLWAHAPVIPIIVILLAARLHARALSTSGAGAALFAPDLAATGRGFAADVWIRGEHFVLGGLAVLLLMHLALLAGITRPLRWLRNMIGASVLAAVLAWIAFSVFVPLGDRGLSAVMDDARHEALRACPSLETLSLGERVAVVHSAFARTSADSPALRSLDYEQIPQTVSVPPALPFVSTVGFVAWLEGAIDVTSPIVRGTELRIAADGELTALPLPDACDAARVVKADRALAWGVLRPLLREAGAGVIHFAIRSEPRELQGAPPAPGPRLVLVDAVDAPTDIPRARVPLPLEGGAPVIVPFDQPSPRGDHPPLLGAHRPPLASVPEIDAHGRTLLVVADDAPWDDVLRAIASAAAGGAVEVYLASER